MSDGFLSRELKCTKKSINPVYPASCACQNPPEIQVEKVDTPQPSRRPEKPDHHLVDNPARSRSASGLLRVTNPRFSLRRQNNYISNTLN